MKRKTLKEIEKIIVDFTERRNWEDSDPNELILALFVEVGELAEHYQWKKSFGTMTDKEKEEAGFEFVDVLWFLLRLADKSGIDIEKYFDKKLPKSEKRFPVDEALDDMHDRLRKIKLNKKS